MPKRFLRFVVVVAIALACSHAAPIGAAQPPPGQAPESQSEFVPVNELPPADQLQAAPLLITAYAFVWVAVLFYVWTIWRRLGRVEKDMQALARRSQPR
ncbi:MAG: CcmD family protein [Acidobacteriota bacterium]